MRRNTRGMYERWRSQCIAFGRAWGSGSLKRNSTRLQRGGGFSKHATKGGAGVIEWFDDVRVGMRFKSPDKLVTREDIKRFAAEFDPQPYHLDEAAAEKTALQGLAASGWHTAAIAMRLATDVRPFGPHPLLGIGVDELRWLAPVRPGDVLHIEGEVVELEIGRAH